MSTGEITLIKIRDYWQSYMSTYILHAEPFFITNGLLNIGRASAPVKVISGLSITIGNGKEVDIFATAIVGGRSMQFAKSRIDDIATEPAQFPAPPEIVCGIARSGSVTVSNALAMTAAE